MDRETKNTMSDSLKHFVSDSIQGLGQNPILKSVVPTVAGAGIALIESLEIRFNTGLSKHTISETLLLMI